MTSLRQVRKPKEKKTTAATVMARVSVLVGVSST